MLVNEPAVQGAGSVLKVEVLLKLMNCQCVIRSKYTPVLKGPGSRGGLIAGSTTYYLG